jgi:hypothetical protein
MACSQPYLFMSLFNKLAVNRIGDEGILYLSRADWPKLTEISLCISSKIERII